MTIKPPGHVTFAPCGEALHPLFRVNPVVPLRDAREQVLVSHPLHK